jgi:transposase InsO family protein
MKYEFIKANRSAFSIVKMCQVLEVSKSGYYKQFKKPRSQRDEDNDMLINKIKNIFDANKGRYGSPRVKEQLDKDGIGCGKNRVARLMRKNNIKAKRMKKFKVTTDSKHNHPVAPNLLNQDFTATTINEKWVKDITYIYTQEGWLYLAVILDLCSRKVVGWSMGDRITKDLVIKALRQAMNRRGIKAGLILHSDRGVQYACQDYACLIKENNFIQSMSGKGNCYDNAVMESFFKTLKVEEVYWERYLTRDDARKSIFEYIECYYNTKRMHSALGYMSPEEFEQSRFFDVSQASLN